MFTQVPVLPVVIPVAVVAMISMVWHLQRRVLLSWPRVAVALLLCVYLAGVIANTVFPIYLDKPRVSGPWNASINLTPLAGYDVADALMNVLVFFPLGVLLVLVLPRWAWWRVLAVAAAVSLGIEMVQGVAAHLVGGGHVADVNDLVSNVIGAALGCGLLRLLALTPPAAGIVDRFRWAPHETRWGASVHGR